MKRKMLIVGVFFLCMGVLFGCGMIPGSQEEEEKSEKASSEKKEKKESESELGDYNVQFGGEIIEEDDIFIIEGTSNLLPDARVIGELIVDEDEDEAYSDTSELVNDDGSFRIELENHEFGEADFVIRFDLEGTQEDKIHRHYGDKGQKLEGPFIYKHDEYDGIFNKAEVTVHYDPNENTDLTLQAPDWHELPNDYGDPRVWIEVEELTEDGEFYYIEGISNILEGSEITAKYGNNSDETEVLPDGSFTFKVDYEYLEDEDFIIEFHPANYQWNEIEEAYGAEGQKLVGDLVVTNKHSDKQSIEKHITWDGSSVGETDTPGDEDEAGSEEESDEENDEDDDDDDEEA